MFEQTVLFVKIQVDPPEIPLGDGRRPISGLKARAVLIDTEDGPVNSTLRGPLGEVYDARQIITDVQSSGAGNNWAHGHFEYGPRHAEAIREATRHATELCDSLQCFFLLHSLGGGTGSGLGTFLLNMLEDDYPSIFRFTTSVFPSEDDDVITSPYNSMLSMNELIKHADCVLPLENQQLAEIWARSTGGTGKSSNGGGGGVKSVDSINRSDNSSLSKGVKWPSTPSRRASARVQAKAPKVSATAKNKDLFPNLKSREDRRPRSADGKHNAVGIRDFAGSSEGFDGINAIAAQLLTNITSSMRFPGQLNTDMNEITTNLVPFPRMHFLVPALAPLGRAPQHSSVSKSTSKKLPRTAIVRQLFFDAFSPSHQLLQVDPKSGTYLANALLLRGELSVGDVNSCMSKLHPTLSTIHWNQDGFKVGLCSEPALNSDVSILSLSNNTCIAQTFERMQQRFDKLYTRKAMIHHYTSYGVDGEFVQAAREVERTIKLYRDCESIEMPSQQDIGRLVPFV